MNSTDSRISRKPIFIPTEFGPLYAVLHIRENLECMDCPLIVCPPIGIDYMNSHRSLKKLADKLALSGTPTLRLDYFGTGGSCDIEIDNQVKGFIESIRQADMFLKKVLNTECTALLGFRFGATLAALFASKTEISYLVLWGGIFQGKRLIREMRLLQNSSSNNRPNEAYLEAGGWVIEQETQDTIKNIDLAKTHPKTKSILLLDGNKSGAHQKLLNQWQSNNTDITVEFTVSISDMLVDAHEACVPHRDIEFINQWVKGLPNNNSGKLTHSHVKGLITNTPLNFHTQGTKSKLINESLHHFIFESEQFYTFTMSDSLSSKNMPLIILLNSGSNHQVGPNRLYVSISRELAAIGFDCLRLDLPGLGESEALQGQNENIPYMDTPTSAINACLDQLPDKPKEIVLIGLCSGAYHAFLAAYEFHNTVPIVESILINPLTFYWEKGMKLENAASVSYSKWGWYRKAAKSRVKWIRLISGNTDPRPIIKAAFNRIYILIKSKLMPFFTMKAGVASSVPITSCIQSSLKRIAHLGIKLTFIFSANDPGIDILYTNASRTVKRLQKEGCINIEYIEDADHTFSILRSRRELIDKINKHLKLRYFFKNNDLTSTFKGSYKEP